MKKIITMTVFLFGMAYSYSQVGINTALPNSSSVLDVVATDRGVLIPRLSLTGSTDATTITNGNVVSLLVYNTATAADVVPGYHFWDGTKWVRLAISDELGAAILTTLVDNGDGTMTYTDENGVANTINTTVVSNNTYIADGTIDINGDGTPDNNVTLQDVINNINTIVASNQVLTTLTDNGNGTMTYVDENGASTVIDLAAIIAGNETLTTLVDNGDGTMTYTDEDGIAQVITTTVVSNNTVIPDGTIDINGDGTPDNNVTLQDIVNNINTIISGNETLTTMVDNTDGTYTYTSEDATVTTIDVPGSVINNASTIFSDTNVLNEISTVVTSSETLTTMVDNTDGTYTYTSEDATATTIDVPGSVINNASTIFGDTNVL
ncbi:hypothetical protein NHF50_10090, partial [Flavobacterium sp. NRK F10]|nr:hypothetical protein [Flavobacterium sp. NRK F10]